MTSMYVVPIRDIPHEKTYLIKSIRIDITVYIYIYVYTYI